MPKLKIYLDTSVLNFYYADDEPNRKEITKELFNKIKKEVFIGFVSTIVIDEIQIAKEKNKNLLLDLIATYKIEKLVVDDRAEKLAEVYVKEKIIPKKFLADALYMAIAVVNDIDVLVSWNFQHIVRLKTIIGVNEINKKLGLKQMLIYSPEEVIA